MKGTRKDKADEVVRTYQALNDQLRESRILTDELLSSGVDYTQIVMYERVIQARIEKQLLLLDNVVV